MIGFVKSIVILLRHPSPSVDGDGDVDGFDYCNNDDIDIKNDLRKRSIMVE